MRRPFTGCGTALVTPFRPEGALDEAGVSRLARRQIDAGIHFLVPCGTTGECPTLTDDEQVRVVELVVAESAGKVPVLAGAGGYNTHEVIQAGMRMRAAGADGLLSVTPYYNKPTPEGLFQHYRAISEGVGLPIVVYNVPGRTGCNVDPATLLRLATIPNVVAVKEASGNVTQMCEICASVPDDFIVLSGDDALTLPLMAVGGRGIVSVASNVIPAEMSRLVELAERGDFAGARALHQRIFPLMQVNFVESNPIPVKSAMASLGLLEEIYRLPMVAPRPLSKARIEGVLQALGISGGCSGVTPARLEETIDGLAAAGADAPRDDARRAFAALRSALSDGAVRAAEPDSASPSGWRVNAWVKRGILLGFRFGDIVDMSTVPGRWEFFDKDTLPLKAIERSAGVRIVPGGSSVREGAYLGPGVICMPPMYVNIGAYVGAETLIDSHALVGSCAQIGSRVHLSACAQIGGVLEPVGALPVIVEDDVLVGGNCGVYEGTILKRRVVLAAGSILTGSTPLYDVPNDRIIEAVPGEPLVVPEGAVVVPGTRPVTSGRGREWGLSIATPIIVKYRDERTSARTALESWIR